MGGLSIVMGRRLRRRSRMVRDRSLHSLSNVCLDFFVYITCTFVNSFQNSIFSLKGGYPYKQINAQMKHPLRLFPLPLSLTPFSPSMRSSRDELLRPLLLK